MKKIRTKKKKKAGVISFMRRRPFMVLAAVLVVMMLVLVIQLPRRMSALERQDEQIEQAMHDYSELQAERNVLRSELTRLDDDAYIETLARRQHGYGWYGETIYEVGNLSEVQAAQEEKKEQREETGD